MNVPMLALFGWIGVALVLFYALPARRAVLYCVLGGWMFLPIYKVEFPGVSYTKWVAVSVSTLLGVLLFDAGRLRSFRFRAIDVPFLLWCVVCPFIASMTNGLGPYDGFQDVVNRVLSLGIIYLLGRIYFHDPKGLQDLAVGFFYSGLVYMPLCLLEIRLSPQLHTWVYGFHQHSFGQAWRLGGWRPTVFMGHGLEVGFWMSAATLSGVWLAWSGVVRRILNFPVWMWLLALTVTTVLCKSSGAIVLLAAGLGALTATRWPGLRVAAMVLLALPVVYAVTRAPGLWSGNTVVTLVDKLSPDRASSMSYRFDAEDVLARHAMRQPLTGWGRWGRNRPGSFDREIQDVATDGLWVITLGTYGVPALLAMLGAFLIPPALLFAKLRAPLWSNPWCAPAVALAMMLILSMIDCLMNAMLTPVQVLAAGGLARAVLARSQQPGAAKVRPAAQPPAGENAEAKPQPQS